MRGRAGRTSGTRRLAASAAAAAAAMSCLLVAGIPAAQAASYVPITGSGSTWSANAMDAWVTNVAQYGMNVSYAAVGSTSGRQEFSNGTVDYGASEIPYGVKDGSQLDPPPARGYAYMPDTAGGTTFMYNLDIGGQRVTNLRLSGATIAGIFTGAITNWDDSAIQTDNPDLKMPNLKIVPVVRSDGSGATAEFTEWMLATEPSDWNSYCAKVGFSPCTQTSAYPVLPGSAMVGQSGDLGVSGYVSQAQADGTIGYVEYSYALQTGFPVALVENAAGYYTEPTAGNVALSLTQAQINMDPSSPLYLTQNLSNVYTYNDPRTYELSSYSYMILPTDTSDGMTTAKGYTLGAFGSYLLCQGQQQVDALGYSALPVNLVSAGYTQLQKIPGNQVESVSASQVKNCNNPTFTTNGTNALANTDPEPPACDKAGPTQCTTGTGGATGSTAANTSGGNHSGTSGSSGTSGASGSSTGKASAGASASAGAPQGCNAQTGVCGGGNGSNGNGGGVSTVNGVATASAVSLGNGLQVTLMALAAALLLCLALGPPLVAQASRRRRQQRFSPPGRPGGSP